MSNTRIALLIAAMLWGAPAAWADGGLTIKGAYVPPTIPGQDNGVAFMRLVNSGDGPAFLVGGESTEAEAVELHSHTMEGGMMRMRQVDRIEVPAHSAVTLEPGGLHLMLIGLKRELKPGDDVDIRLDLDDRSTMNVVVPVRNTAAEDGGR